MDYHYLAIDDRQCNVLIHERLRLTEVEHFKATLEYRLCGVLGIDDERQIAIKAQISELEVQAAALAAWLQGETA
jgi:hypothetical protein